MCEHESAEACINEEIEAGHLEIDAEGRIWRVKRWVRSPGRVYTYARAVSVPRHRVDHLTPGGYFVIARGHGGHLRSTTTARLIWYRAHGPIPAGLQINHIDGVRSRDVLANLELATSRENSIHRDHVIRTGARVKLTDAEVIEIRRRLEAGEHPKALARAFGIGRSTVLHIRSRHTWRHL